MRKLTVGEAGQNQLISFAQKIIAAVESKEEQKGPEGLLPSKASTKEAENPELATPRNFTAGAL